MKTIYALDLGKFNTVSCLLTEDHSSIPVFKTIMTNSKTYKQFLLDFNPSLLGGSFPQQLYHHPRQRRMDPKGAAEQIYERVMVGSAVSL